MMIVACCCAVANAVWIDMQYFSTATSCPASEVSLFTNITVRNLDIGRADTAYTIVGLSVPGSVNPAITGIVLENITGAHAVVSIVKLYASHVLVVIWGLTPRLSIRQCASRGRSASACGQTSPRRI